MTTVSIIIPVYNEKKTIVPLLQNVNESVRLLSPIEFEVIVVNDGSTDSTARLIEQHSDLWNVAIDMPHNSGEGGAVLAALKRANGDFCTISGC